ncbi:MAG: transcriptional regulator [bacterium]|nr:transcriptional regulator [bacterium]
MREADVVLTPLPQADGKVKIRPALLLRRLPPFGDYLVCGISSQLNKAVAGFDDLIRRNDPDFTESGLVVESLFRLGFLAMLPRSRIAGNIGSISLKRHQRLLVQLSRHLLDSVPGTSLHQGHETPG